LGQIVSQVKTSEGVTTTLEYSYDLAGRLVAVKQNGVVTESYEYDANGNRVQAFTSSQGMVVGSYDDQGSMVGIPTPILPMGNCSPRAATGKPLLTTMMSLAI